MCRSKNSISLLVGVRIISATVEISLEMSQVIKDTSFFKIMQRLLLFFFSHFPSLSQPAIHCGGQKQVFPNGGSSPCPGPDFSHNCSSDSPTLLSALPPPQRRKEAKGSQRQQHLKRSNKHNYMSIFVPEPYSRKSSMILGFSQRKQLLSLKVRETHPGGTVYLFPTHLSSLAVISSDP